MTTSFSKLSAVLLPLMACASVFAATPSADDLHRRAHDQKLAENPEWQRLLHYHRSALGVWKSDVDGEDFFLSKRGRTHPIAELDATLDALIASAPASGEQPAYCRYPARRTWLEQKLNFTVDIGTGCERYDAWRDKLNAQGVAMVFSSYYMNNPASMYGHTFLRLERGGPSEGRALLDYTINYAAETHTNNGLLFALFGLTGGFRGKFATHPYYMKVQQYNNLESRDLWEYPLTLTKQETDLLVAHLWEMGQTSMSYYFFNKNCSYELLPMLDVARPSLHLADRFRVRAIPLDTLRAVLDQPGLMKERTLRPSHRRQMLAERDQLSPEEIRVAGDLAERPSEQADNALLALPLARQRAVLDASFDYFRTLTGFAREQPESVQLRERHLLQLQHDLTAEKGETISFKNVDPPESAHGTGRGGLAFGVNRRHAFEEVQLRMALHDLEADARGFIPGSELEMMSARLRYDNQSGKGYLENFTAVNVKSLSPWQTWVHKPSWAIRIAAYTLHDLPQPPQQTLAPSVSGGSGMTAQLFHRPETFVYALTKVEGSVSHALTNGFRGGAGGECGFLFPVIDGLKEHVAAEALRFGWGDASNVVRLKWIQAWDVTHEWELRTTAQRQNHDEEIVAQVNRYF